MKWMIDKILDWCYTVLLCLAWACLIIGFYCAYIMFM